MKGWVKLHRKITENNMYKSLNSKQRDVLISCLLLANHNRNEWMWNGELFVCEAGQFITSIDKISKLCSKDVNTQNIRTALLKLEKWGFLTNESTKTGRLITICKWDDYQSDKIETNKQPNKELTKSQQRPNKELTTNKNVKNDKDIYHSFAHLSISKKDNQKLINLGYSQEQLNDMYSSIENYSKNKTYSSLYLTTKNWLTRNKIQPSIKDAELSIKDSVIKRSVKDSLLKMNKFGDKEEESKMFDYFNKNLNTDNKAKLYFNRVGFYVTYCLRTKSKECSPYKIIETALSKDWKQEYEKLQ